jgi:hypothetical protein
MFYFAYGSNMDWAQMRGRCPSAKFVAIAELPQTSPSFYHPQIQTGAAVVCRM